MIPESERYDAKGTVTPVASSIENNGAIAMKFYSPADGNVVPLTEVSDQAFSSEALGKGIAVKPTNGTIVSPEPFLLYIQQLMHMELKEIITKKSWFTSELIL